MQSNEEQRKSLRNKRRRNPAGNFQLFTIFLVHFTLLSERTKEFFSLFLINYGNYSGCLHYASGVEKTKLLCSDLWNVTVYSQYHRKNVCSLKWTLSCAVSIPWLYKQIYKKRCNDLSSTVTELKNRFPRNPFIDGHFNVTAFPDFVLCHEFFITWVTRSLVTT